MKYDRNEPGKYDDGSRGLGHTLYPKVFKCFIVYRYELQAF